MSNVVLSSAAAGYLHHVYGCSSLAELGAAQRLEVRLAARDGQALFVELARALPPSPDEPREDYAVDATRSVHPGCRVLVRLGVLALAGALVALAARLAGPVPGLTAACIAALIWSVYLLGNASKLLALVLLDCRRALALGVLGVVAGLALLGAGFALALQAEAVTPTRRSPWVAVGLALGVGGFVTVACARLLAGARARGSERS